MTSPLAILLLVAAGLAALTGQPDAAVWVAYGAGVGAELIARNGSPES